MIKSAGLFLLLLLKIAGWIALILFLLLLAIILLVLLVPVRYHVSAQNTDEAGITEHPGIRNPVKTPDMRLTFTWLMHIFHVSFLYDHEKFRYQIRLGGIDPQKLSACFRQRKKSRSHPHGKKKEATEKRNGPGLDEAGTTANNAKAQHTTDSCQTDSRQIYIQPGDQTDSGQRQTKTDQEPVAESDRPDELNEMAGIPRKLKTSTKDVPAKKTGNDRTQVSSGQKTKPPAKKRKKNSASEKEILKKESSKKETLKKETLKERRKKTTASGEKKSAGKSSKGSGLSRLYKEFTDETNRSAALHLWKEICYLFTHYRPQKLQADLSFSLADPSLTGRVLGALSLLPVIYRYPCRIVPDFESESVYFTGSVMMKGKISVTVFLISCLRILRDKNAMGCMRRLMGRSG